MENYMQFNNSGLSTLPSVYHMIRSPYLTLANSGLNTKNSLVFWVSFYKRIHRIVFCIQKNRKDCMQWMSSIHSSGYVMTSYDDGYQDRTMFECVDSRPEYIHGQQADTQGGLLHFVTVD